ncbi:MAG: Slp family lipoprotein [Methylovulum sp.]|nr:Slp family lipoprotein [Methylovulum sp.]
MRSYLLALCCLLLGACSNLPPAIQDAPLYDLSYRQASQNLASYKEAPVRWGGVIIDVENEQDYTLVQVLSYPLGNYGRPLTDETGEGRFVFKSTEFLDPAIYAKNTEITVAGVLKGDIERSVGKKTMRLPLVAATTLYQWPAYELNSPYGYGGYGGFGYGPYNSFYGYYPYYWGGFYRPYPYYRYR